MLALAFTRLGGLFNRRSALKGNRLTRKPVCVSATPGSWLAVWLPMAGMLAMFVWSLWMRRRARTELETIERLRAPFADTATSA
jgi:hypothetical protein